MRTSSITDICFHVAVVWFCVPHMNVFLLLLGYFFFLAVPQKFELVSCEQLNVFYWFHIRSNALFFSVWEHGNI